MTIGGTALVPPLHCWYIASSTNNNGGTVPATPLLILETYDQKSKVLVFELGWVLPCEQHHCLQYSFSAFFLFTPTHTNSESFLPNLN
jgi:hypothetical protein